MYPAQDTGAIPSVVRDIPPVPFDDSYIIDVVTARSRGGRDMVSRFYFAIWNSARGCVLEEITGEIRTLKNRLSILLQEVDRTHSAYKQQSATTGLYNWNNWALARFIVAIVLTIVLAVASFSGVFQLLSNTPAYASNPVNCLAVSALALAIPFAIELFPETLRTEEGRIRVNRFLAGLTAFLFVIFAVLLAMVTGGNGASLPDPLGVENFGGTLWGLPLSVHLQYIQLFLEVSAALCCFSYAALLYLQHVSRWQESHPVCEMKLDRATRAQEVYRTEHKRLGELKGLQRALLAQRNAYVFTAVSVYLRRADIAKRQENGILRKQGADSRTGGFSNSPVKRAFDRFTEFFSN